MLTRGPAVARRSATWGTESARPVHPMLCTALGASLGAASLNLGHSQQIRASQGEKWRRERDSNP